MRYLDPKHDLVFKKVFGHAHLLQSFLNALLPLETPIISLEYLPAELVPEIPLMKHSIVDVRCKDQNGRQFIVEMQMLWTDSFKNRVLFNASKAYVRQMDKAEEYSSLEPVFSLNLVNQIFEKDSPHFYHHYAIVHLQESDKRLQGLEFIFVELPKFRPEKILDPSMSELWLRFLTEVESDGSDVPQILLENELTKDALAQVQESSFSRPELEAYDRYWDSIRWEVSLYSGAKKEGLDIGLELGRAEGMEKGIEKGIEKGREETLDSIARAMKNSGMSPEQIHTLTGLSLERIISL